MLLIIASMNKSRCNKKAKKKMCVNYLSYCSGAIIHPCQGHELHDPTKHILTQHKMFDKIMHVTIIAHIHMA